VYSVSQLVLLCAESHCLDFIAGMDAAPAIDAPDRCFSAPFGGPTFRHDSSRSPASEKASIQMVCAQSVGQDADLPEGSLSCLDEDDSSDCTTSAASDATPQSDCLDAGYDVAHDGAHLAFHEVQDSLLRNLRRASERRAAAFIIFKWPLSPSHICKVLLL
jgi:hypothetical protein